MPEPSTLPAPRRACGGRLLSIALACALSLSLLGGCAVLDHGMLGAGGPVAEQTRSLFLTVCVILLFVVGPVLVLTPIFAWHYRLSNTKSAYRPQWGFNWSLEGLIWIPPVIIVVILAVILWRDTHRLDPYKPLASALPPVEVQVVALDWKWLFVYPDEGIASVNELVIPVGRPVHLSLTSATVMQSFFVPQLAGQIYAMAGMTTQLNLAASRPGVFRGENAQFNGMGFQNQKFPVRAEADDAYRAFVARARATGSPLDMAAFKSLSARSVQTSPSLYGTVSHDLFRAIVAMNDPTLCAPEGQDRR